MANTDTTCAACARLTENTRDSSGSMASQMRCAAMLAKVAKESNRMERRVAAEMGAEPVVTCRGRSGCKREDAQEGGWLFTPQCYSLQKK